MSSQVAGFLIIRLEIFERPGHHLFLPASQKKHNITDTLVPFFQQGLAVTA